MTSIEDKPTSRKIYLILGSIIISVICSFFVILIFEKTIAKQLIQTRLDRTLPADFLEFYKKESLYVNHLRDLKFDRYRSGLYESPNSLMYSIVGEGETKVLLQGDSWGEQFYFSEYSRDLLLRYSEDQNVNFVVAGISSFSPSLMTAQLLRLRNSFNMREFDYVVTFVDQTDIGDELCRYRSQRAKGDFGLVVKPFDSNDGISETYNTTNFFSVTDILTSDSLNIAKLIKIAFRKLKVLLEGPKCGWEKISKPLSEGVSNEDGLYLKGVIKEYIEEVFKDRRVKHLMFVTFPHRKHLTGEYKLDVYDLIHDAINESSNKSRVTQVHPSVASASKSKDLDIYKENDLASHLTDRAHADVLTTPLLDKLSAVKNTMSK